MLTLAGHKDWIRAIDFATYTKPSSSSLSENGTSHFNDGDLILASASQDKYIRLWKVASSSSHSNDIKDGDEVNADTYDELKVDIAQERLDELVEFDDK